MEEGTAITRDPGPNIAELDAVLEIIAKEEKRGEKSRWKQNSWITRHKTPKGRWSCSTAMCVAGWVVTRAGWKPVWNVGEYVEYVDEKQNRRSSVVYRIDPATGKRVEKSIPDCAREILRLEEHEAADLFSPGNALPTLRAIRNAIHYRGIMDRLKRQKDTSE